LGAPTWCARSWNNCVFAPVSLAKIPLFPIKTALMAALVHPHQIKWCGFCHRYKLVVQ